MFITLKTCSSDSQRGRKRLVPLSAVLVAQLADFIIVWIFPHQHVIFSWHASRTVRHAEESILEVGTPCAVSTTLVVREDVYNRLLL